MKKIFCRSFLILIASAYVLGVGLTSCSSEDGAYKLQQQDIRLNRPEGGFTAIVNQLFKISVISVSDEGVSYQWLMGSEVVGTSKTLEYMFEIEGTYPFKLRATQGGQSFEYPFVVKVAAGDIPDPEEKKSHITRVIDFKPAAGQYVNELPVFKKGDTQVDMNQKVLQSIGKGGSGMISLGGFGGYVTVGFDHTIENKKGLCDFRVLGNAFYAKDNPDVNAPLGGSCEPGIILVAYDTNKDGFPNEDEWYEIAGSSYKDATKEPWYDRAVKAGNDVRVFSDYEITYFRPAKEPVTSEEKLQYIRWEDNKGNFGYKKKNNFHTQPYFPQWIQGNKITFKGKRLPQNGIDESGKGTYYVLYKFGYGYADNAKDDEDDSTIDIDWAVNAKGEQVHLPGVDFIKIYTGVNQENGWQGECSTEISGIEDLHLLGTKIQTRK